MANFIQNVDGRSNVIHKKEFYFVRHGQTAHNAQNLLDDPTDVPLNAVGRLQAFQIEPVIAALPVKTICFSPRMRAKETKNIICSNLLKTKSEISECEISDLAECSGQVWREMTAMGCAPYEKEEGHVYDFMQQVRSGINQALAEPGPVLIVAHGGVHWAMCSFMNVEHEWAIDNCVPVRFFIDIEGNWKAEKLQPDYSALSGVSLW